MIQFVYCQFLSYLLIFNKSSIIVWWYEEKNVTLHSTTKASVPLGDVHCYCVYICAKDKKKSLYA